MKRLGRFLGSLWTRLPFWLKVAVIAAATFDAALLGWWTTGASGAEFPLWLESAATLAALIAAVVAARYVRDAFELEFRREQRYEDARVRAQADLVAAWFDRERGDSPSAGAPGYRLANRSDLPIYDVFVSLNLSEVRAGIALKHDVIAPNEGQFRRFSEPENQKALDAYYAPNGPAEQSKYGAGTLPPRALPKIELRFRDAAGVVWVRQGSGQLQKRE